MRNKIKLHWASSKPNFGDLLSPLICELVSGKKTIYSEIEHCDLISTGSLLQRAKEWPWTKQFSIWGTGFIAEQKPRNSKHIYHALRGLKSSGLIKNKSFQALGDPGILASELVDYKKSKKRFRFGIIPHYKDQESRHLCNLKAALPQNIVIDVFEDVEVILKQISQCEFIVSSSLHGLVVADSMGIPNQWIKLGNELRGGRWKFEDYYSVFNIGTPQRLEIECNTNERSFTTVLENYQRPNIDNIKQGLTQSFPNF
jgi:pyruvyltransferase